MADTPTDGTRYNDLGGAPEAELGDLPDHVVPAELVELHQLQELARAQDGGE